MVCIRFARHCRGWGGGSTNTSALLENTFLESKNILALLRSTSLESKNTSALLTNTFLESENTLALLRLVAWRAPRAACEAFGCSEEPILTSFWGKRFGFKPCAKSISKGLRPAKMPLGLAQNRFRMSFEVRQCLWGSRRIDFERPSRCEKYL